ncbi:hypothetical protein ACFL6S_35655 [Candidatus Poribacteria bacterium]
MVLPRPRLLISLVVCKCGQLAGADKPTVIALDENGYATDRAVAVSDGTPLVIQLAGNSVYHIVKR